MAEAILEGTSAVNYIDDIIVGAQTVEELLQAAIPIFDRLEEYGLKVNYRKVTWCAKRVKFLGFHLEEGQIKIRDYLEGKWKALTQVNNIQQLERAIGILSYCRRSILGVGQIIEPLNKKLIEIKKIGMDEEGWGDVSELVEEAF